MTKEELIEFIKEVRETADNRADCDCVGDPPHFVPNAWMSLFVECEEVLRKVEEDAKGASKEV